MKTTLIENVSNALRKCKTLEEKQKIKEDFYNLKYKDVIKDNMWQEIMRKYQSTCYEDDDLEDDDLEDDGIPYEEENDYNPELEIPDIHGENISW